MEVLYRIQTHIHRIRFNWMSCRTHSQNNYDVTCCPIYVGHTFIIIPKCFLIHYICTSLKSFTKQQAINDMPHLPHLVDMSYNLFSIGAGADPGFREGVWPAVELLNFTCEIPAVQKLRDHSCCGNGGCAPYECTSFLYSYCL